jgi:hypothetical protein
MGECQFIEREKLLENQSPSLWAGWWNPNGILNEKFGFQVIYDAYSRMDAKISCVIKDGNWFWKAGRSDALVGI